MIAGTKHCGNQITRKEHLPVFKTSDERDRPSLAAHGEMDRARGSQNICITILQVRRQTSDRLSN